MNGRRCSVAIGENGILRVCDVEVLSELMAIIPSLRPNTLIEVWAEGRNGAPGYNDWGAWRYITTGKEVY